jgi:hypothetical protein
MLTNLTREQEERLHTALDMLIRYLLQNLHSDHQRMVNTRGTSTQHENYSQSGDDITDHTHVRTKVNQNHLSDYPLQACQE